MAYALSLPQTITEEIMRYAVGYPHERMRALSKLVVRTETWHDEPSTILDERSRRPPIVQITWRVPNELKKMKYGCPYQIDLTWRNWCGKIVPGKWYDLEVDRRVEMWDLQDECEACEPNSLSAKRSHF